MNDLRDRRKKWWRRGLLGVLLLGLLGWVGLQGYHTGIDTSDQRALRGEQVLAQYMAKLALRSDLATSCFPPDDFIQWKMWAEEGGRFGDRTWNVVFMGTGNVPRQSRVYVSVNLWRSGEPWNPIVSVHDSNILEKSACEVK